MHVDEFIDDMYGEHNYARWFLFLHRLPAVLKADFDEWIKDHKLFCTYENKRWRCTGASRLGDVWLAEDFERDAGYDKRVDVEKCTSWAPTIEAPALKCIHCDSTHIEPLEAEEWECYDCGKTFIYI